MQILRVAWRRWWTGFWGTTFFRRFFGGAKDGSWRVWLIRGKTLWQRTIFNGFMLEFPVMSECHLVIHNVWFKGFYSSTDCSGFLEVMRASAYLLRNKKQTPRLGSTNTKIGVNKHQDWCLKRLPISVQTATFDSQNFLLVEMGWMTRKKSWLVS